MNYFSQSAPIISRVQRSGSNRENSRRSRNSGRFYTEQNEAVSLISIISYLNVYYAQNLVFFLHKVLYFFGKKTNIKIRKRITN